MPSNLALTGGEPQRSSPFPAWPIYDETDAQALLEVLHSGAWFLGAKIKAFSTAFATFQEAEFGIAVANGTVALQLALSAIDIRPGDEVIVPAYTFIATASAVAAVGGIPIFVDIDPQTYTIDPKAVEAAITARTKAIIAVHMAGRPADLDALGALSQQHRIALIEDAAQAHGAAWKGRKVGALGTLGTFSFQASKNLNAGEGGCITTNDRALAERAWSLHNCGRAPTGAWYEHPLLGGNYRMTEFQAGLLLNQIKRLDAQIGQRQRNGALLDQLLVGIDGIVPLASDARITTHAYHLYIFRYDASWFGGVTRDRFIQALQAEGIPCSAGYVPLYRESAFQTHFAECPFDSLYFNGKPDYGSIHCPQTERICADEAVWLTQNLLLGTADDMRDIAQAIAKVQTHYGELQTA